MDGSEAAHTQENIHYSTTRPDLDRHNNQQCQEFNLIKQLIHNRHCCKSGESELMRPQQL